MLKHVTKNARETMAIIIEHQLQQEERGDAAKGADAVASVALRGPRISVLALCCLGTAAAAGVAISTVTRIVRWRRVSPSGDLSCVSYSSLRSIAFFPAGIPTDELFAKCKQNWVVNNLDTLKTFVKEFRDHDLIRVHKAGDASSAAAAAEGGKAVLFVPLSSGEMKALVEQIRSMEDVVHD